MSPFTYQKKLSFILYILQVCLFVMTFNFVPFLLWQTGWDLRLACLLLYAFDREDNFWQLYGDFLPSADECPSLLLASEVNELKVHIFFIVKTCFISSRFKIESTHITDVSNCFDLYYKTKSFDILSGSIIKL